MSKRYKIENIADVFNIPEDRFDDFLVDFASFYHIGGGMADLTEALAEAGGIKAKAAPSYFVWIDDGKHEATVYLTPPEEPKL